MAIAIYIYEGEIERVHTASQLRVSRCPLSRNIADMHMADLKFVLKDKQVTEEMKCLMK